MGDACESLLSVVDVTKRFPGVLALDTVSFQLLPGEIHAFVGENGAGKSTLIKILSGVEQPDSGSILLAGDPVQMRDAQTAVAQGIGTVQQDAHLVPLLSVAENILLGRQPRRGRLLDLRRQRAEAERLLTSLNAPIPVDARIIDLSPAQRQMVAIARALSTEARVVIFDEPTAALSQHEVGVLFETIRMLKARGAGVIYISHRLAEIFELADRVTVLRDGRMVGTREVADVDSGALVSMMIGRPPSELFVRSARRTPGQVVLRVEGVAAAGFVEDASFDVREGELVALAGLVGSGRSELVRAISGAEPATAGTIELDGRSVNVRTPADALKLGIGLVPEDRKAEALIPSMSVRDNLTLPALSSPRSAACGFWYRRRVASSVARAQVDSFRIKTPTLTQKVMQLSGGNQQRVALAKWIETKPRLLILDEPTHGVDIGAKADIYKIIADLLNEGTAILMVSSDLPEVAAIADRVLVMRRGRIAGELRGDEITEDSVGRAIVHDESPVAVEAGAA